MTWNTGADTLCYWDAEDFYLYNQKAKLIY